MMAVFYSVNNQCNVSLKVFDVCSHQEVWKM